jgi:hypothetical protein
MWTDRDVRKRQAKSVVIVFVVAVYREAIFRIVLGALEKRYQN